LTLLLSSRAKTIAAAGEIYEMPLAGLVCRYLQRYSFQTPALYFVMPLG